MQSIISIPWRPFRLPILHNTTALNRICRLDASNGGNQPEDPRWQCRLLFMAGVARLWMTWHKFWYKGAALPVSTGRRDR
jgi:hypothetical protein